MTEEKKTSPWLWVGCGCAVAILLLALAVGGAGFFVANEVKDLAENMQDPEKRAEKVREVLGSETLPPGFHPMIGFSVPFVMDMAMLSDRPAEGDGEPQDFGEAGVIYIHMKIGGGSGIQELRDYFAGREDDPAILRDNNINLDIDRMIARGETARDDLDLYWATGVGDVDAVGNTSGEAITAMLLFDCPEDEKVRLAIWFERLEKAFGAGSEVDTGELTDQQLVGTPADPARIEDFAGYFRPCG